MKCCRAHIAQSKPANYKGDSAEVKPGLSPSRFRVRIRFSAVFSMKIAKFQPLDGQLQPQELQMLLISLSVKTFRLRLMANTDKAEKHVFSYEKSQL